MLEDKRVKPSCGNVGEEEGVGLEAGKGSKGPCYEADSSPQRLTSELGRPFAHLRVGEEVRWEKGCLRGWTSCLFQALMP